ncbi:MAG: helix-turn-helix domain-containing protein [Actinopolymorphaceae bacterium]
MWRSARYRELVVGVQIDGASRRTHGPPIRSVTVPCGGPDIAAQLGRSPSMISRELRRNTTAYESATAVAASHALSSRSASSMRFLAISSRPVMQRT